MNHYNQGNYCTKIQLFSMALMGVLINILMSFVMNHYLPVNTPAGDRGHYRHHSSYL